MGKRILSEVKEIYSVNILNKCNNARFEVFMTVKIQVEVFWAVTPCSVTVRYQCFRGPPKIIYIKSVMIDAFIS
jgi:hypothetical protein